MRESFSKTRESDKKEVVILHIPQVKRKNLTQGHFLLLWKCYYFKEKNKSMKFPSLQT